MPRVEDDESSGSAHPDLMQNYRRFMQALSHPKVRAWVERRRKDFFDGKPYPFDPEWEPYSIYEYKYEYNPITKSQIKIIHDPVYVMLCWVYNNRDYAHVISFSQSSSNFETELKRFFNL